MIKFTDEISKFNLEWPKKITLYKVTELKPNGNYLKRGPRLLSCKYEKFQGDMFIEWITYDAVPLMPSVITDENQIDRSRLGFTPYEAWEKYIKWVAYALKENEDIFLRRSKFIELAERHRDALGNNTPQLVKDCLS
jgi:hypothetical protein